MSSLSIALRACRRAHRAAAVLHAFFGPLVQNPLRRSQGIYTQGHGETMELLDLQPPDYGVHSKGIYIIDDDGLSVFAGPFESEAEAIAWIIQRQETLTRHRSRHALAIH